MKSIRLIRQEIQRIYCSDARSVMLGSSSRMRCKFEMNDLLTDALKVSMWNAVSSIVLQ